MKNRMLAAAAVLIACLLLGMVPGYAAGEETDVHSSAVRDVSGDLLLLVDFQNVYLPGNDWACPSMPDAIRNTIKILAAENTPDYFMTRYIAPADPIGRWEQYNEAYREINDNDFLAEIVEELAPYAADAAVVDKSTYSSMDAPEVLAAMEGKRAVVLTGVVADC